MNVVLSLSAWVPSVHSGFPPLTEHTEPGTFWDSAVVVCLYKLSDPVKHRKNDLNTRKVILVHVKNSL